MRNNKKAGQRSYRLLRAEIDELTRQAEKKAKRGREICGLMLDNGYTLSLFRTRNASKELGSFSFHKHECRRIERAAVRLGFQIVGTFHSHPYGPADPGKTDILYSFDDFLMLIIGTGSKSEAKLWRIRKRAATQLDFEILEGK